MLNVCSSPIKVSAKTLAVINSIEVTDVISTSKVKNLTVRLLIKPHKTII